MTAHITQRELRNDSGEVLRAVENGATFVVTRNGSEVARLSPVRRRPFVTREELKRAAADLPPVDGAELRADLDAVVDQETLLGE